MTEIDEIKDFIKKIPKDDFSSLYQIIFLLEDRFDCRLLKFDRKNIEFHMGLISEGEKTYLTDGEWEDFTNCWSWRHLDEWIINDGYQVWADELAPYMPKDTASTTE